MPAAVRAAIESLKSDRVNYDMLYSRAWHQAKAIRLQLAHNTEVWKEVAIGSQHIEELVLEITKWATSKAEEARIKTEHYQSPGEHWYVALRRESAGRLVLAHARGASTSSSKARGRAKRLLQHGTEAEVEKNNEEVRKRAKESNSASTASSTAIVVNIQAEMEQEMQLRAQLLQQLAACQFKLMTSPVMQPTRQCDLFDRHGERIFATIRLSSMLEATLLNVCNSLDEICSRYKESKPGGRELPDKNPMSYQTALGFQASSTDSCDHPATVYTSHDRNRGLEDLVPLDDESKGGLIKVARDMIKEDTLTAKTKASKAMEPKLRPISRKEPRVNEELKLLNEIFALAEEYTKHLPALPASGRFHLRRCTTMTFTVTYPDGNKLHIGHHKDTGNADEVSHSISVFEDRRDEYTSGLFVLDGPTAIFAGPGLSTGLFHKHEHAVMSPMWGKRYSIVIYCKQEVLVATHLKSIGAVFHATAKQRANIANKFEKIRGKFEKIREKIRGPSTQTSH